MCGIAGIIYKNSNESIRANSDLMATSLNHRGPDDSNVWIDNNIISLVHTRLSIQDTSNAGKQPMQSKNQRYIITYNGEIYNFKSLKTDLETLGHTFIGGSDTEVILASIEQYGLTKSLQTFEGMFAFALWDKKDKKLFLCRDRMGEKPLFYCWHNNIFSWASELKSLKSTKFWEKEINREIIPQYLKYGYVPTPYSIYEGVYKLIPGTYIEVKYSDLFAVQFSPFINNSNHTLSPTPYWTLSDTINTSRNALITNYSDAVNEFDTLLNRVVSDQMISDVPFGSFLSGGIDSSLITSIMQSQTSHPINTFTIGFKEKDFDEAKFAKEISRHLGTMHNELYISSNDCLETVSKIPTIMDEPFADSSVLPAYFVSSLARQHVTVSLSGDAGDELFCGYNRYTKTPLIWDKVNKLPTCFRKLAANILYMFPPGYIDKAYKLISVFISKDAKNSRVGLKIQKLADLLVLNSIDDVYDMLISYCKTPDTLTNTTLTNPLPLGHKLLNNVNLNSSTIEKFMAFDTATYLLDDNLVKVDRTSMASSLETRLPLLNHRIVEFAWTLPLNMKAQANISKRILRDTLYKRVPKSLIERPKMGFSVPISNWIKGPLKEWAHSLLFDASNTDHNIFKMAEITKLWNQHISGERDNSASLWSILMFQAWYKESKF